MTIAFVAASSVIGTTLPLPTGAAAGHVMVVEAFGVAGIFPTVPAGWTQIATATQSTSARGVLARRVLDGSESNAGVWTDATRVVGAAYSGVHPTTPTGAYAAAGYSNAFITVPALTCNATDGSSWIVGFASHRSPGAPIPTAVPGLTTRAAITTTVFVGVGDTSGGVTGFAGASTATTNSNTSLGFAVELIAAPTAVTGNASSTVELSGAAAAAAMVSGDAAAGLGLTGTADGVAGSQTTGVANGDLPLGGAAAGTAGVKGNGAAALPLGGAAGGAVAIKGGGDSAVGLGGAAAGRVPVSGATESGLTIDGGAVAAAPVHGIAAGGIEIAGLASSAPAIDWDRLLASQTPTRIVADREPVAFVADLTVPRLVADARPIKFLEAA